MGVTRREVLRGGGAGLLWLAAPGCLAGRGARARVARAGDPLLVVIFLRGGADALHLLPPVGDPGYARLRGSLALEETLPFATGFGLHPAFAPATDLALGGRLAAIPCAGSHHPTRSHFEAQDFMEAGEPGTRLDDGWMARALRGEARADLFSALALAGAQPFALRGSGAFALDPDGAFEIPGASPEARRTLAALYGASPEAPLRDAALRALAAVDEVEAKLGRRAGRSRRFRRPRGVTLEGGARRLIELSDAGLPVRAAFLESQGWDTHANQGGGSGAMARGIEDLAKALAALDATYTGGRPWLAVVHSEFGRTVRPNGSGGSDHGHGGAMLVAGPRVRPGIHGAWPGLAEAKLYEGRDLPVVVDYRSVLHEALVAHLGAPPPPDTFPGFTPQTLGLVASAPA